MMIVSIYTSRVILEVLGVSDFGIYNVVWGITSVIVFFNGSLSNVAQRYMNIGLGEGNIRKTSEYFNQFLIAFSAISLFLLLIGEVCMNWVVEDLLIISEDRIYASKWLYQCSLLSLVLTLLVIPYTSNVIARERMDFFAYVTLFESFGRLGILYLIRLFDADNLILYGVFLLLIQVIVTLSYIGFCKWKFEECEHFWFFDKQLLKEMSSFVGYNVYGCFAFAVCQQGINVILNNFFGPVVNAARAIAMQVYSAVYKFSDSILMSVRPPVIKLYAQKDNRSMVDLATRTTKYCLFINTIITLPILFNIDFILRIWLKTVPDFAGIFVIIIMIESYFNIMCQTITILVNATGDLKRNQLYGRTFTLLSVPIAYLCLMVFESPIIPVIVASLGTAGYFLYDLYDVHLQLGVNMKNFIKETLFPVVLLHLPLVLCMLLIKHTISNELIDLILIFSLDVILGCAFVYYLFLDDNEKAFVKNKLSNIIIR